jgi:hypothetical protein
VLRARFVFASLAWRSCSSQRPIACRQNARSSALTAWLSSSRHSSICFLKNSSLLNDGVPDKEAVLLQDGLADLGMSKTSRKQECRKLARIVHKLEDRYALDCVAQSWESLLTIANAILKAEDGVATRPSRRTRYSRALGSRPLTDKKRAKGINCFQ